ncbi:MAG: hypothetical protein M1458_02820 [Deltaproteobacteria bacterium]|nr:hypothetical protein [Deltaproteobacteria bacterium]
MIKFIERKLLLIMVLGFLSVFGGSVNAFAATYGVFTQLAVNVPGSPSSIVNKVKSALNSVHWNVVGTTAMSLPKGDTHKAIVIVATNSVYNKYMVDNGSNPAAAFGLPLRVAVYTTPTQGTVVSMLNLPALARTFSGDSYVKYAIEVNNMLKNTIRGAVGGSVSNQQYGPMRSGRFPGGIGGGSFPGSISQISNYSGSTNSNLRGVAKLVETGISHNSGRWRLVYEISQPSIGFIEFGVTRNSTERHAVAIDSGVRATSAYRNPGIDHAPSFPIEILVYRDGKYTDVSMLGEMWRMKYYFSDAGILAFMTHMGMPGSIQGSLKQMVLYGLAY